MTSQWDKHIAFIDTLSKGLHFIIRLKNSRKLISSETSTAIEINMHQH